MMPRAAIHCRRTTRLDNDNYADPGNYFVTICAKDRRRLFGHVDNGVMRLNLLGAYVWASWLDLPYHYPHVELDAFIAMPNHVHGIVRLSNDPVGAGFKPAPTKRHALPEVIRGFKTFSSRRINRIRGAFGEPLWQRNYYDHIVRNSEDLRRIRAYVLGNPQRWRQDRERPAAPRGFDPRRRPLGHDPFTLPRRQTERAFDDALRAKPWLAP